MSPWDLHCLDPIPIPSFSFNIPVQHPSKTFILNISWKLSLLRSSFPISNAIYIMSSPSPPQSSAVRHAEKRRTSTCLFADRVAHASVEIYRQVIRDPPNQTCMASILVCHDDKLYVVGMGVGTKFLSEQILQTDRKSSPPSSCYGERVRDCHAEVLARRSFRRFLTLEILRDLGKVPEEEKDCSVPSILQRISVESDQDPLQYSLRSGVSVHFYSSSCPCGNATIKKFATLAKERFRADVSSNTWPEDPHPPILPGHSAHLGQFALLLKRDSSVASSDETESTIRLIKRSKQENDLPTSSLLKKRLTTKEANWPAHTHIDWCPSGTTTVFADQGSIHTCSDKLARWNVLGLQGSLLASVLMEPLHMSTLTVGRKLSSVTCRRAVCCRIQNDGRYNTQTPVHYEMNHPAILGTGVYLDNGVVETIHEHGQDVRFHSSSCYAWWPGLDEAEQINGSTGYASAETTNVSIKEMTQDASISSVSRISTIGLTKLFLSINNIQSQSCSGSTTTLAGLREFKENVSSDYEHRKQDLLTKHPQFKLWNRRYP